MNYEISELSVLIPVHNFKNIANLVISIVNQLKEEPVLSEILLIDDASDDTHKPNYSEIGKISSVRCIQLEKNIGRAAIRNFLAKNAHYNYLLFLDCDVEIPTNFIKNYLQNANKNSVVCGGKKFLINPIDKDKFVLRYKYGKKREEHASGIYKKHTHQSFITTAFGAPKNTFNKVQFNTQIQGYGHEDTLFGLDLKNNGIAIKHIINPVMVNTTDSAEVFLEKSRQAVKNLVLVNQIIELSDVSYISLLKWYYLLKKYHLVSTFSLIFALFKMPIVHNLHNKRPILIFFDLYRMDLLIRFMNK